MKLLKVTLSAGVTDTPLAVLSDDPFASDSGRSKRAYELLSELQRLAEPFDLQTRAEALPEHDLHIDPDESGQGLRRRAAFHGLDP